MTTKSLRPESALRRAPARTEPSRRWGEAQALLVILFALLGAAVAGAVFVQGEEVSAYVRFLTGQSGFDGAFSSPVFWKIALGLGLGGCVGLCFSMEIPAAHLKKANRFARGGLIVLLTILIYIPSMSATFLWDDDQEITANPSLANGGYGLWEIWTGGLGNPAKANDPAVIRMVRAPIGWIEHRIWGEERKAHESADYFPLKTTMLWLEYQLWGPSPYGYHVVNILVHAADALLLWLVLSQLRVPGAWLGALLFAVHPAHVESVAWIAERKNTLSLFFYLLSVSAFLKFEETGRRRVYLFSLLAFLGALLCKTSVVMLPVVLVLLVWWRGGKGWLELARSHALRLLPFFALSLVLGLVTVWFQNGRAIGEEVIPIGNFWSRLAGAGLAAWWYVEKAILPVNLTTIYPRFPIDPPQAGAFVAGALFVALLGFLLAQSRRIGRTPFFVLAYFAVTLFPVLGFFKMSYMRLTLVADHFQYLSDLSFVAAAGALAALAWEKAGPALRPAVTAGVALLVTAASVYSWERAGVHHSPATLWPDALAHNEPSWQAHNHLGAVIYAKGDVIAAGKHFARAVELKPDNPEVHNNLGLYYAYAGRLDDAIEEYARAVEIKGDVPAMRRNLADALSQRGRFLDAAEQYRILLEGAPNDPNLLVAYGYVLYEMHRHVEARAIFEQVLRISPGNDRALRNLQAMDAEGK